MTDIHKICSAMYKVKGQGDVIKLCVDNPKNNALNPEVLKQIQDKCGDLMPLSVARSCARELGMSVPEIPYNTSGNEDKRQVEPKPDYFEERKSLTPWGRLAVRAGLDVRKRYTLFKDAFKEWNAAKHDGAFTPAPSNDGTIDRGWRIGTRYALTTEPGLTRWPGTNILFKGTLFDITVYDHEGIEFDRYEASEVREGELHYFDNGTTVSRGDNFRLTLAEAEIQIPLHERDFFEIGAALIKEDILWWKNSNPVILIPLSGHIGFNWQFQGTSLTTSDSIVDVNRISYMLSSYTMFGLEIAAAAVNLYSRHKAAEFCNRVSNDCGDDNDKDYGVKKSGGDYFSYGQETEIEADFDFYSGIEPLPSGEDATYLQAKLTAHLFGEQRGNIGAINYRSYTDYYPTWEKAEIGGQLSFHLYLGQVIEWFVEGEGRKLWSLGSDDNILLPDNGYELGVTTGLGFRPSGVF